MHTLSARQLLTCRYWAFGPRCPDIDASNVQTCHYAHWDTGRLADFYGQRGTCYEWFQKRTCPFGASCSYEHRDTGVMGLNQGMLVLHGLNLEIADAANKSGFNTRNQVALMDLIWSVRRIAFRHAVESPRIQRPPKHPVYPDRYRPGDPSDNTNKARKRGRESQREHAGTGTAEHPIYVDDDDWEARRGGTAAKSSAKRLKVAEGQTGRQKFELPERPKLLNPIDPMKFVNKSNNRRDRGRNREQTITYMPSPRSLNFPPARPSSVGPIFGNSRPSFVIPRDMTILELRKVGNTFKDNVDAVMECSNVMKTMYTRDERLSADAIYMELEILKGNFDSCLGYTQAGMKTIDKILSLLEDDKDCVSKAVNQDR